MIKKQFLNILNIENLHTDLSGIIRIRNEQQFNYFLLFVDDYTRFCFVHFKKACFKKWASRSADLNLI